MKVKRVSAAVIRRGDEILATLRSHGEYRGYWEFPGGKWKYTEKEKPRKRANAISPASGVSVMKIYQQYCVMDLYAKLYQLL